MRVIISGGEGMKVIVAGSRTIANRGLIAKAMTDSGFRIDEVVCGCARGVDTEAAFIAKMRGIPIKEFPADWDLYGKRAGYIRNAQMADYADALILIWDGKSRGSANMLKQAREKGLLIYEKVVEDLK